MKKIIFFLISIIVVVLVATGILFQTPNKSEKNDNKSMSQTEVEYLDNGVGEEIDNETIDTKDSSNTKTEQEIIDEIIASDEGYRGKAYKEGCPHDKAMLPCLVGEYVIEREVCRLCGGNEIISAARAEDYEDTRSITFEEFKEELSEEAKNWDK